MYLVKTPKLIQQIFPNYIWKMPEEEKAIYLTFDDGPIPDVTPWVLQQLNKYNAQATFFCVGDNVNKYPEIYNAVIADGHMVGNHTYNHLNGWLTDTAQYYKNIKRCATLVKSDLFRPPYGKISRKQAQFLKRDFQIIMWDILSGDFDNNITKEQCLENVIENTQNGSLIVFHDSLKAWDKLQYVLPRILKYYSDKGYVFKRLENKTQVQGKEKTMAMA
ncbi:MAG TPA: polysaccharide deacetylase family protein [Saprospiraceae bacterium]|nr:polysaccharide deacetylase family protein [Saprospiraceae bacterium]